MTDTDDKPLTFYEASAALSMHGAKMFAGLCAGLHLSALADYWTEKAAEADKARKEWRALAETRPGCPQCDGVGSVPVAGDGRVLVRCPTCGGTGTAREEVRPDATQR